MKKPKPLPPGNYEAKYVRQYVKKDGSITISFRTPDKRWITLKLGAPK